MNLPLKIARRYLFAKKSTNAINIISGIAVFGIAVGSAALVLVLSVFNGFEDLITGMYNNFNPDVKIIPKRGKTFEPSKEAIDQLWKIDGVAFVSQTLEEVALFDYKDNQYLGIVKGVDTYYREVSNIDSTLREGSYTFTEGTKNLAVVGLGIRSKLGINIDDQLAPISVYMPKSKSSPFDSQPFYRLFVYPRGTFSIQTDFDNKYVLTSLEFARQLLKFDDLVSAIEIKLHPGFDPPETLDKIRAVMGPDFNVKNRDQQEASFFKLMKMEKWLSFAIVGLMMVMIAFNLIGALWMIVLDKKSDIAIMKSMGAQDNMVRNIFLNEGLLLCTLGLGIGFFLAILIFIIQKTIGLVTIPGNLIVDAYPISMRAADFMVVAVTVILIGLIASLPPALSAKRIPPIILEE